MCASSSGCFKVDLSDGGGVRGAPPRIDQAQFLVREGFRRGSRVGSVVHPELLEPAPGRRSSSRLVCCATIKFSSVGTPQTEILEPGAEMRGPPAALAASSSVMPSQLAS